MGRGGANSAFVTSYVRAEGSGWIRGLDEDSNYELILHPRMVTGRFQSLAQ